MGVPLGKKTIINIQEKLKINNLYMQAGIFRRLHLPFCSEQDYRPEK